MQYITKVFLAFLPISRIAEDKIRIAVVSSFNSFQLRKYLLKVKS